MSEVDQKSGENTARMPPRPAWKVILKGYGLGLLLAFLMEAFIVLLGGNFHMVVASQVFRTAQPSPERLRKIIKDEGIRTVINLRGCCAPYPWYLDECRVTQQLGVSQEDICFSAGRMPPKHEVKKLVEVLDHTEYPVLIHCNRGADRTGLASAVAMLLRTDASLAEARRQLGPRYGHVALGRPANLDRFFDLYSQWLQIQGIAHSKEAFRQWVEMAYCAGECQAQLQLLGLPDGPIQVRRGEPFVLRVRCRNTSINPWRLRSGNNAGIHACVVITDETGLCVAYGKAGLFNAEVAPGDSIDLTFALSALWANGTYHLLVDMIDEQQGMFFQEGSEPLEREIFVREQETQAGGHVRPAGLAGLQD